MPPGAQTFQDILQKAKEPDFMSTLRVILSICKRNLEEKESNIKRRWTQLRNSNISQIEFMNKEKDIQQAELDDIISVKEETIDQLYENQVMGTLLYTFTPPT